MRKAWIVAVLLLCLPGMSEAQSCDGCGIGFTPASVSKAGGTINGPLLLPDGATGSPSLGFSSDADGTGTGIYRSSANEIAFTVNGLTKLYLNPTSMSLVHPLYIYSSVFRFGASADMVLTGQGAGQLAVYNADTPNVQTALATYGGYSSYRKQGVSMEEITLSTAGATTDSTANLLPAGSVIEAVAIRVTEAITGAGVTSFHVGDATIAARFASTVALAAGTTDPGLLASDLTGTSGPKQLAAAKIRITANGATPTAGKVRVLVYYSQYIVPAT